MEDSKTRFSDRVSDYRRFRPSYPPEVILFVQEQCGIDESWKIADIGSGTGISSRLLCDGLKCPVFAVEPNDAMRKSAEEEARRNPLLHSVNGCAESTTLDDRSMDLVCAFQAFHWFDKELARREFVRILKEPGWVLLVWNDRVTQEAGFPMEYEKLLATFPQYRLATHKNVAVDDIGAFLRSGKVLTRTIPNSQKLDWEGLRGRFSSSSYTPRKGSSRYPDAISSLRTIFDVCKRDEAVEFKYETQVFLGILKN